MEQGNKIVLAIIVGALIIGIAIFLSFGGSPLNSLWHQTGQGSGEVAREVKEIVAFNGDSLCGSNVYNCGSFDSRGDAQGVFDACGGIDNDVHFLDGDKDGVVCEGIK